MKKILNFKKFNESYKPEVYNLPYRGVYEWVSIDEIMPYREFDRKDRQFNVDILKDKINKNNFKEPLILHYSDKYKTAYLTEGNHRLLAAQQLGIEYVPIRVTTDGIEKQTAKKVRGLNKKEIVEYDEILPSQIGFKKCLDRYGNPIIIDDNIIDDNYINYDDVLYSYKDVIDVKKVEDGCYTITIEMKWWDISNFIDSEKYDRIDACLDRNIDKCLIKFNENFLDFLDGDYFTDEMKSELNIDRNISYKELDKYFNEIFINTKYYKRYVDEVKRIVFEKYQKYNLDSFLKGGFPTPYDGVIEWLLEKPHLYEIYNIKGIVVKNELIECYEDYWFDEKTFFDVMKKAYYNADIWEEYDVYSELKHKIRPDMLNFDNIFTE